jgi:iron(III) transport system substrate-binding protein
LPAFFEKKFGVRLEYLIGRSSEVAAKLRLERQAGISTIDVFMAGVDTLTSVLYKEQMIEPLRPQLILPEVVEPSNWKRGEIWFSDPERKYALRLNNRVSSLLHFHTQHVKREDLKSVHDLLNPRWRGRIAVFDPTLIGTGIETASSFYVQMGEEFVKKLYIDQRPVMSRETRQLADWLARGTYPLVFSVPDRDVERLQHEGVPLDGLYGFPDFPGAIGAGSGLVVLMKNAPHPNAARLLINWMASKEGVTFLSRIHRVASTRNDVDESFLPQDQIPRPGASYFDLADWDYAVTKKGEIRARMAKILRPD